MTTKRSHRNVDKPKLNLPPAAVRGLTKMGYAGVLRDLKRAIRGETSPESCAVVKLCRQLLAKFDSVCPTLDGKLAGSVVGRLVDTVQYANGLSQQLGKITRINGRDKREQLRRILMLVEEVEVRALRRQVQGLRRDLPRLLEQLEASK
jgi:hypothetical protein